MGMADSVTDIVDIYPLSPMQQGLLFHSLSEPTSGLYVAQFHCLVEGDLNVPCFRKAWQKVVDRHPALRTDFEWESADEPLQIVYRSVAIPLEQHDWRSWSTAEQQKKWEEWQQQERVRGFTLDQAPLLRLTLIQLAEHTYRFVLTIHHILFDARSLAIIIREALTFYSDYLHGNDLHLSPSPSFKQYIGWLHQQDAATTEMFWQKRLRGFNTPTPLGIGKRLGLNSPDAGNHNYQLSRLPGAVTQTLGKLAQQNQFTLGTLVQGSWALLLAHYSGHDDVLFGTTISIQPPDLPQAEFIVGNLLNTLPLRATISQHTPAVLWFKQLQEELVAARQHGHSALTQIQEWSDLPPGMSLFESILGFTNFSMSPGAIAEFPDLKITDVQLLNKTNYPLSIWVDPGPELGVEIAYDGRRFDADTISRMLTHLQTLLTNIAANPQQRLAELPLLPSEEQQQLLVTWNETHQPKPHQQAVHRLLENQASQHPDAAAVIYKEKHLTYGELDRRANQLAHYLRQLGIGQETIVGIYMERSPDMVIGILGILKAGGAYLPLDPAYPQDRLAFMLADSEAPVLLTQADMVAQIPTLPSTQPLCLDSDWERITQMKSTCPAVVSAEMERHQLAYVIYTSGSTGQPKGVQIEHRGLLNLVAWHQRAFAVSAADRATQIAGQAFDASVWEIWPYLTAGSAVMLVPDEETRTISERMRDWLVTSAITICFLPTPLAEAVLSIPWPDKLSLHTLLTGGDKLHHYKPPSLPFRLVNNYGPTENSVVSTFGNVPVRPQADGTPDIGRPIDNVQIYLLDAQLRPVPVGIAGELYIGGGSLARGYLNRAALTAEKFIPHPFSRQPGSRLYRTGDLARYRPDGNIEFLGRNDEQVKIRGYRIELGEIETILGQYPAIQESAVLVREDGPGKGQLVAFIVAANTADETIEDLLKPNAIQTFLREKLPAYMAPSIFTTLEDLPLTPNGKIDRQALLALELDLDSSTSSPVSPRTPEEKMLAKIWAEVLGVEEVSIHDNFFALGGDSILSIRMVANANQQGFQLVPGYIYDHPTIAELVAVATGTEISLAEQGPVQGSVPLTPIQSWFFEQDLSEPHHFNQALMLQLRRPIVPEQLETAFEQILSHHDALRLRFTPQATGWRQFNEEMPAPFMLVQEDLTDLSSEAQQKILGETAAATQASLNIEEGPLLRAVLFYLGPETPARLLIVVHHLAIDNVSWSILLADLEMTYEQLERAEVVQLPSKTTAFKQWAEALVPFAQSEVLLQEQTYWSAQLSRPLPTLPVDRPEGKRQNTVASMDTVEAALTASETQSLLQEVTDVYQIHINEFLLAALARTFNQWTGHNDLLLEMEGHGREGLFEDIDLSRTVGWFTAIFPIRLKLTEPANLDQVLKSVKEQVRQIPRHGVGYGLLRYLCEDTAVTNAVERWPQAEVLFDYLGQFDKNFAASTLFSPAPESVGPLYSPDDQRHHLLEVVAFVSEGQLQMQWMYSQNVHQRSTIEQLAAWMLEHLRALMAFCLTSETDGRTPVDFPLTNLDQTTLDQLLAAYPAIEDIYPLTPSQLGMFFHALYHPESEIYFAQSSLTITGSLDIPAFRQAWQQVVTRHPILRTSFVWEESDEPLQIVHRQVDLPLSQYDWRDLPADRQREQWHAHLRSHQKQGFTLTQAPLMNLILAHIAPEKYYFAWSSHHVVMDGWSLSTLLQEVFILYESLSQDRPIHIEPARPYRDYVSWLQQQDSARAEAFWRETLRGFREPTPLHLENPSRSNGRQRFDATEINLTADQTTALQAMVRQHELTLNILMQGVWALMLSYLSGKQDIVFGCTVAGRPTELQGMTSIVGSFINVLPVRLQVPAQGSFWTWLEDVQRQQVQRQKYEYSSLAQIQRWSEVQQPKPLFETMFTFENAAMFQDTAVFEAGNKMAGSLQIEVDDIYIRNNFPLTLKVVPWQVLEMHLLYEVGRFDLDVINHTLTQLQAMLEAIVSQPNISLPELFQLLTNLDEDSRKAQQEKAAAQSRLKLSQVRRKAIRSSE